MPARRTISRVSLTLSAQQFSPKTAMRQRNGVLIVVPSTPVAPLSNSINAAVVSPVGNFSARAFDSALTRFIGPARSRKQSSTWMPMPVMPPARLSSACMRQLSAG